MIIECKACRTRFRLDESRIKGRGARVRCRRCGELIVVMKADGQAAVPAAPPAAEDSLDLGAILRRSEESPPEPTRRPDSPPAAQAPERPESPGLPSREPEAPAEEPGTPAESAPVEPVSGAESAPPSEAPPPSSGPGTPGEFADLDAAFEAFLSSPSSIERGARTEPGTRSPAEGDEAFGSIIESASEAVGRPEEAIDFGAAGPADFLLSDADTIDFLKNEPVREAPPAEFDISAILRAEPVPGEEQEKTAVPPPPAALPREQGTHPSASRSESIQDELADMSAATAPSVKRTPAPPRAEETPAARPVPPKTLPVRPEAQGSSLARPSVVLLLMLFIALAGGGAYLGFTDGGQETLRRLVPGMESLWLGGGKSGPRLEVGNLIGYYEGHAAAGRLFVVKGQVTNQGRSRRSGIRIHAALLDAADKVISEKAAYAGNVLPGDALRTAPKARIEEAMANRFGDRLVNMDVAPGRTVPFMVVFFGAPDGIEAYRLEAREGE